ncbi:MAG: DUF5716 family protein [Eubacteriales bacterium]|nr:DUF5716 family protein [Eubacteriales bacterium]
MFLEKRETKNGIGGAIVGFDLTGKALQMSFLLPGGTQPETLSVPEKERAQGAEPFWIPAALARLTDQDLWLYGGRALEAAKKGEAFLAESLLENAVRKKQVQVGEQLYDGTALLSLFLKRAMSLLPPAVRSQKLSALVFSVEEISGRAAETLSEAVALLELAGVQLYVIGRAESFFYYNISQPRELWLRDVLLCDFTGLHLRTLLFTANRRTTPVACLVEEKDWETVRPLLAEQPAAEEKEFLDRCFLEAAQKVTEGRETGCVYLIGAGFDGEWYRESLKFLCRERRVFLGSNLYSKGACYAAMQRLVPGGIAGEYAFLGRDMVKANLGMSGLYRGRETYLPLLDAGVNWYEAGCEREFLLEEKDNFSLRITPLNGGAAREVQVKLAGLPDRPPRTTRIRLRVEMTDVSSVRISMEDLGFGEFFAATHRFWEERLMLEEKK